MCRDGWCLGRGFQLLSDLLEACDAGELPRLVFCISLAEAFQAPAAIYLCVDDESQQLTFTCWPSTDETASLTIVVENLWRATPSWLADDARGNTPSCASQVADVSHWRGSVADLLLWELGRYRDVAQLPLTVAGPELRLLALFRRRAFSERDMHLLRTVHAPLATVDHLVVAAGLDGHGVHDAAPQPAHAGGDGVGGNHLTAREVEVLSMLAEGLLARSIAARMHVSTRTVHKHLGNVYRKLEAHDRLLAVARAQSLGLIPAQRGPPDRH